jgi:quercetin dioxygenase-like cupin family protein
MEILPKPPTTKGPPDRFTGDAWFDLIVRGVPPSRIRASIVRFAPGARNAWHAHPVGQTLHVLDGRGRTQSRGGDVIEIRPGDTIQTPPGEWHWHGAAPDHFLTHLTVYETTDDGAEAEWGDHVTDAQYLARPTHGDAR